MSDIITFSTSRNSEENETKGVNINTELSAISLYSYQKYSQILSCYVTSPIQREIILHYFRCQRSKRCRKLRDLLGLESLTAFSLEEFDKHKCIFVHIPKCAGVSICRSLFGNIVGHHLSIAEYRRIFSREEFSTYFKFAFVRNPWDRLVDAYYFLKAGGWNERNKKWSERNLSAYENFSSFVKMWVNPVNVKKYPHFRPQRDFICIEGDNTPIVDFIGYFERLDQDFTYVSDRIGMSAELMHLNKTPSRGEDYKIYYDSEMIEIVSDTYRDDIKILGYNFDNSSLKRQ
jgi:hypothetical protein